MDEDNEVPLRSEEFLISREALDEAMSALMGARAVCGDIANISHAMNMLKTAQGNCGDMYE